MLWLVGIASLAFAAGWVLWRACSTKASTRATKLEHGTLVLRICPGAGGPYAIQWTETLSTMYRRWAERNGWHSSASLAEDGSDAIILTVQGADAETSRWAKGEVGVHQFVGYDETLRTRYTSFAAVTLGECFPSDQWIAAEQIRTYVTHPYSLVTDHRSNIDIDNAEAVLGGELDDIVC